MSTDEQEVRANPTAAERAAKAEDRARKSTEYAAQQRRVAIAEQEVPGAWQTGEVTKEGLAQHYGVSTATIKRIIGDAGLPQGTQRRLTTPEKQEIAQLLASGTSKEELMEAYSCSANTIRKVGLDFGVLKPGERKPQRSDDEYRNIEELDALAINRFGSGLYNLGVGLRSWRLKQQKLAEGTTQEQGAPVPAPLGPGGHPENWRPPAETPPQPGEQPVQRSADDLEVGPGGARLAEAPQEAAPAQGGVHLAPNPGMAPEPAPDDELPAAPPEPSSPILEQSEQPEDDFRF